MISWKTSSFQLTEYEHIHHNIYFSNLEKTFIDKKTRSKWLPWYNRSSAWASICGETEIKFSRSRGIHHEVIPVLVKINLTLVILLKHIFTSLLWLLILKVMVHFDFSQGFVLLECFDDNYQTPDPPLQYSLHSLPLFIWQSKQ